MKTVELYARVRHSVLIEGISERAAADRFGINARTVSKMLKFSVPPGYVRAKPPFRPKLDEFTGVIDAILAADKDRPKKQRHTSKRIFERLRDEHGFRGKITIVKDYVAGWRQRTQEMFVPLVHPPGHAQAGSGANGRSGTYCGKLAFGESGRRCGAWMIFSKAAISSGTSSSSASAGIFGSSSAFVISWK
jgi:hypothetical protein